MPLLFLVFDFPDDFRGTDLVEDAAIAEIGQLDCTFLGCHLSFVNLFDNMVNKLRRNHVMSAHGCNRQRVFVGEHPFVAPDTQGEVG